MFVGNNDTILIRNVNIDSVYYYCLILKGSNHTSYWNNEAALADSRRIFDVDLYHALNRSEEVRERYAEPELDSLLIGILTKWKQSIQPNSTVVYTYTQKEYDIQQVEELAKTKYHLTNSSEFINNTLSYLQYAQLPPPPPAKTIFGHVVNDPDNWLYVCFLGGLPLLDFTFFLIIDYYQEKRPSKLAKWLFTIPSAILAYVLVDLLYYSPYDYRILSVQTIVVIALWICGVIAVFKIHNRLVRLIPKQAKPQQTDKQANQKPNQKIKTNEENQKPTNNPSN